QHQNIVPVYFVGTERGVHYYAMQFIDGHTLADVIETLRQDQRRAGGVSPLSQPAPNERPPAQGADAPRSGSAARAAGGETTSDPVAALSTERSARGREYFRSVARL